jgi:hypothetical protein
MTTDIPDWIAFFAIVGMEEFRLILKGIALNGVSAKVQPLRLIQPCRR